MPRFGVKILKNCSNPRCRLICFNVRGILTSLRNFCIFSISGEILFVGITLPRNCMRFVVIEHFPGESRRPDFRRHVNICRSVGINSSKKLRTEVGS